MPPFLLISASAYLAPSTSLCASAESTPVSGLTMPILTGSSPREAMMNGAPMTWLAPSAMPALSSVRRRSDVSNCDILFSLMSVSCFVEFLRRGSPVPRPQTSSTALLGRSRQCGRLPDATYVASPRAHGIRLFGPMVYDRHGNSPAPDGHAHGRF